MASSDFTDIRVEGLSWDTNVLRYSYALTGTNDIWIYRSTAGAAYEALAVIPSDYGSSGSPFYDNTTSSETAYAYKLSDDAGSTFTAPVTVVSQKHFPAINKDAATNPERIALPVIADEHDVNPQNVQQIANTLQDFLNGPVVSAARDCTVCPVDGALILDCTSGCYSFTVLKTDITDINSISTNCDQLQVNFDVPEGTTIEVCGWPPDLGFTGDECFQAPPSSSVNNLVLVRQDPTECPNERIRIPAHPCKDYTRDCYTTGSLFWLSSKYNYSLSTCVGQESACCIGNEAYSNLGTAADGSAVIFSRKDGIMMAGFSILFGRSGAGAEPWEVEGQLQCNVHNSGKVLDGNPVFGLAFNVDPDSTISSFTGHVLLMDYPNLRVIFGSYSQANIKNGDIPTIIGQANMTADMGLLSISNFPSVNFGEYKVFNSAGNTAQVTFSDTGHVASSGLVGFGFIWVANTTDIIGNHVTDIRFGGNTSGVSYFGS